MEVYIFPLSLAQRQLWYQEIIAPGNTAYNIPIALRLVGNLNREALEESFRRIIRRHEILRTTFAIEQGEPVQLVHSEQRFFLEQQVVTSSLEDQLKAESRRPFDLVKGPLLRGSLYQLQQQEHILLVNMHHLISDGWSLGIFVQELTQFYRSSNTSLPELPIQYGDYAQWQATWLQEATVQQQLSHWEKVLTPPLPILDLPLDQLRPSSQTFNGALIRQSLPAQLTETLTILAQEEGATFFMAALAVYQILLFRYSGQTDIIVGTPIANRQRRELNGLIGYFVNTLPIRGDLCAQLTYREFLRQITQTCLAAYANQEVPLELLIDRLQIKRDPSHPPIFQTLFALQNAPIGEIQLPGLTVTPIHADNGGAKFDLSLILEPTAAGWSATLEYNTDLFTSQTARRILTHYQQILKAVAGIPDLSIHTLPLLTAAERQQLLDLSAPSVQASTPQTNIVELFTQTARKYPERIAVTGFGQPTALTYQELNQKSQELANFLQQKGVSTETRVGIFQQRSPELVISLLAVLKAGGTYIPLDPQYPPDRLQYIAQDSGITLLLTESALLPSLPLGQVEVVVVDQHIEFFATQTPLPPILPAQAAYIIYTSGSTGQPKGCVIPHSNVVRLMQQTQTRFEFRETDVWTLFHSFAFDFSVWEIWGALLYGGRLVVVPYFESRSPADFRRLLRKEGVTVLNQTPGAFRQLIQADQEEPEDLLSLRLIIFGGEALELQSLKPWIDRYGDAFPRLINMYGITETTVHVTYRPISTQDLQQQQGSVIGQAIADVSLYILDQNYEPVPIGVPGEIYVGGMGVARGYLNRPALTASRFLPDPHSSQPGARLYRTGDMARPLGNGDREYLGRCDLQVKIRGFRIELGEIEAAITALPQVAAVVVTAHTETSFTRLVAYIVPQGEIDRQQLRSLLQKRLPDYMIPAAWVFLDTLPLTAQGKINRQALPPPDWHQDTPRSPLIAPQTPTEQVICSVWQQILGLDGVGVEDNFFDLGGDSILALRVVAEMRRQGWVLTPKDIFQAQTVKRLAAVAKIQPQPAPTLGRVSGEVPLTPIQEWFFALNLPHPHHWHQAVLLEVNNSLQPQTVAAAIQVISHHHDSWRLRFLLQAGTWRQFYTENDPTFAWEILDLSRQPEAEQNAALEEAYKRLQGSLNLTHGPIASATWINLGTNRPPRLLLIIHHLMIDGVSWRILLQDLAEAISGKELLPVTTSFQQWSYYLQDLAKSTQIQAQTQYWLHTLSGETSELPLDLPNSLAENWESSLSKVSCQLTPAQTQIFLTQANKAYHTQPQDLLLAALAKTLIQITSGSSLLITMEGHGREEIPPELDVTRTLGWFTVLYPLRLELPADSSEAAIIKSVKEQLHSVPQGGLGYGLLRYLCGGLGEAQTVAPVISFNYLGQVRTEGEENQLFRLLPEDVDHQRHPQGLRPHILDIVGIVIAGELRLDWLYSRNLHHPETIFHWVDNFHQNLLQILNHCCQPGVGGYTPADFPLAQINHTALTSLEKQFPNLEDIYPLSPLQEGMLFHTVYGSEDSVYVEQVTGKISGQFDPGKFALAWQTVIHRHPVLRSSFVWQNQDTPLQIVNRTTDTSGSTILEEDWRHLSAPQQAEQFQQYLVTDRHKGFQLDQYPLMRFSLIRSDDTTWQWIWSHHHIILDGWSLPIILKEVLTVYKSPTQSLPLVPGYGDYIQWLATRNYDQTKQFWQETLAGITTSTRLAWWIEEQRETGYGEVELRLTPAEFALLQNMAQTHRLTLNTLAQGAWAICLQKHGAGEDVVFGVTVSGRPPELPEVENMVGLFINTLPLRVTLNPAVTVSHWLAEIQQRQLQMREYEYSKLTDIQKALPLAAGEPLFESIVVFENYPVDKALTAQAEEFQFADIQFYERTNYPLTLGVIPDDGLLIKLNFQRKLLSVPAAKLLLERLSQIIVNLATHPHATLGGIFSYSSDSTLHQRPDDPPHWGEFQPAHRLFEVQADSQPEAVAVVCGAETISYGELEQRANQLATMISSSWGVGAESIVGLYFDPSIAYIIALLAVLKAGGAFLPLDCTYPPARLQLIVEDSRPQLILALEPPPLGLFPESIPVLSLTSPLSTSASTSYPSRPENLAYIIYTSGSTGKPKGVLVTHAGIQNLVRCQTDSFGVTPESRVYQFASLNFDAAVSEIFLALGKGATLYFLDREQRVPSPALWETLTAWQITHLTLPPSLLSAIEEKSLPQLQSLIVAGETVSADLLRRWHTEGRRVFNAYGPTEATVCATILDCDDLTGETSIGQSIANVSIYLLDPFLLPVAPGVPGEIYIGGIGLARGYLNRPGLTAAAFIPHPFTPVPGARLYKTGDRGVLDNQGNIHFLGRQDEQVKFHGYRIELGEIETALTSYPGVESAVVIVRQRIIAYILTPRVNPPTVAQLQDYLATVLPGYMLPSAIVRVNAWPLTPNGKIDRSALPAPELPTTTATEKNPTEEILANIWAEVLALETVNPDDNFFELGGDSIISLQIVSRARAVGWDISPKDIFTAQTLARLAAKAKPLQLKVEVKEPLTGIVPLSPIQHWFFAQNWPHPHHWNQVIALKATLNLEALATSLDAIVAHHDVLRLGFRHNQGQWEQFYAGNPQLPPLRSVDFSNQEASLTAILEQEHQGFHLHCPPLLRVLYVENHPEYGDILYLIAHHLVIDGVSWRILIEDLHQAYHQAHQNQPITLPPKTSSYRQWTTALEELSSTDEITKDIPYWEKILSTPGQPHAVTSVDSIAIATCELSPENTHILLKQATATYHASVQEIMLAALIKTLTEAYKFDSWLIDLEGHGREELIEGLDLSRTIGWFTSLYPVLLNANGDQDLLLKEVKTQLRSVPHHGISFGLLRYFSQKITPNQTAAISFNYLGQVDEHKLNLATTQWLLSNAPTGLGMFAKQQRPHPLAINARIQDQSLQVNWSYSHEIHHPQTMQNLAETYIQHLCSYLTGSSSTKFYSASDFQLVDLSEGELSSILEDLD